jgi:branched-chain amino acid transport system ATP-binding protein
VTAGQDRGAESGRPSRPGPSPGPGQPAGPGRPGEPGPPAEARGQAPPALEASHLSRNFRGLTAVADVSLRVAPGARFGIIGPNGAGKTTLFNLLSGELRPTTGSVALFGRDITALRPYRRVALGLGRTFQITRIFSDLTVLENLTLALHGLSRSKLSLLRPWRSYRAMTAEAAELAASFGLAERLDAAASALSHGEVRELEVLLALALKPKVLLLDEPAAGLSPAERVDVQALLNSLPADLTLIMIEHDIDVLRGVVNSAAVLHLGTLVVQGSMRDIQNDERVRELYLGGAGSRAAGTSPPPGPASPGTGGQP